MTGFAELDPFDLPDWLGSQPVTWHPDEGGVVGNSIRGRLLSETGDAVDLDLLAVDDAYPAAVAPESVRTAAHLAWRNGQVHAAFREGRATLLVPGSALDADLALRALGRLAKAVGAAPGSFRALLRVPDAG